MQLVKESVISVQDCVDIIKSYSNKQNFQIVDYEVKPFSDSVNGFMGDHLLITIIYEEETVQSQVRFFAKRFPFQHELHTRYALSVGAFTNEIFTYNILFNKFKKFDGFDLSFAPKYYFGKDNDILVFEDLLQRGFAVPEKQNALSLDHITLSLEVLAKYHAGSIGYQELKTKENGKKYKLIDEYSSCMQEPLFRNDENFLGYGWFCARLSALNACVDLLPPDERISTEEFKNKLKTVAYNAIEILKPKNKFYNVLLHGDMWGKNVLFRYVNNKPVECKLIDFQLQRYGPPAHDVLQFIYLTSNLEDRRNHFHDLLHYYYNCLKTELKRGNLDIADILPLDDFENSINYLLPQIKLQTAYFLSFQGANPKFHKEVTSNGDMFKKFCFEDGSSFSTDLFKTDPNYRKLMTNSLNELKNYILYPRISVEDCFKILKNKLKTTDYNFVSYHYEPLNRIGGFLGDHYKLKINIIYNNKSEILKFFAKCVPESETRFNLGLGNNAYKKEAFILRELLPLCIENNIQEIKEFTVPHYLLRTNDVLIFDDLEYSNYFSANPQVAFSVEELKLVISKLAIFNAANIILEEKLSTREKPFRIGEQFEDMMKESFFTHADTASALSMKVAFEAIGHQIDFFSDIKKSITDEDFKERVEKVTEASYEVVKPSKKFRNVVCHGDLWSSNIMMKYLNDKPFDCYIIDYQILRYAPPAYDLLILLYLTTNRKIRTNYMQELIDYYYEQFSNMLQRYDCDVEKIYSYQRFMESCKYFEAQATLHTVCCYQVVITNSDFMKEYISDEEASNKIFMQSRKDFMIDMCNKDPVYREKTKESIQDLLDACLKYF